MELAVHGEILKAYGFSKENINIQQMGSGLINRTFLLSDQADRRRYILQEINIKIFKDPDAIASNISAVAEYLREHYPDYLFPSPVATIYGNPMAVSGDTYWRLFHFVENTVALEALTDPKQAYEAAKQFGRLSRLLNDFPAYTLKATIPHFHDLSLRYDQFLQALESATAERRNMADALISKAKHYHFIVAYFNSFQLREDLPDRVMHHDTKISNVLLERETYTGVCVIDLDTLMPGKIVSDLGDMMRTYLTAFTENEPDINKITIRIPYFEALISGYLSEMGRVLTATEQELILFSGKYMVYMQALRFLTDFLNGNIYYHVSHPEQNFERAANQFKLLTELYDNEPILQDIVEKHLRVAGS